MTNLAVGNERSVAAGSIAATLARPRTFVGTIALVAVFGLGLLSGMAVEPALRSATQPATGGAAAISAQAAAQAHALWLQGELDSYGSAQAAQQAQMLWLRGELDSYGTMPASPVSGFQGWLAYRDFRMSEEGYAP